MQMALDRALADEPTATVFRLYRWERGTLSLGANESARHTWNRCALEREDIAVVRRPTGGRGVWHDEADLTYAATGPLAAFGGLRPAYRNIHQVLATALRTIGLNATVAAEMRRPTLAPGACFDLAVGGEVLVAGRKVIGSAQAIIGTALLQHGAIALADRAAVLARFRLNSAADAGAAADPCCHADQAADAIVAAWRDAGATPIPEAAIARGIAGAASWRPHFEDAEWTWRR